jgi:hypothetical protein
MRHAFLIVVVALACPIAWAQDLDTTAVSDQFDSANRGQAATGCPTAPGAGIGCACVDGSDGATITNTAGVTGSITYVNAFAGASTGDGANGESPVVNVTTYAKHPDWNQVAPTIAANTRPGATSASSAVVVCDDGGHNGLFFGESDDKNYFIQADVYCEDRSGLASTNYEAAGVCVRAASREGSWIDYSFNYDRTGSFAIIHDRVLNTIEALKWSRNATIANITTRLPASKTVFASQTGVTQGWHTFRIEADDTNIKFWVDGLAVADVQDASYEAGYAGLVMREGSVANASEHPAYFDNMSAGPYANTPTPTATATPVPPTVTPSTFAENTERYE